MKPTFSVIIPTKDRQQQLSSIFLARPRFAPLLLVWQVANLAGFLTAWFESSGGF